MKKRLRVSIPARHPAALASCGFMVVSAALRLWHYLAGDLTGTVLWLHLLLPVGAVMVYLVGMFLGEKGKKGAVICAVILGVAFFLLKAASFTPVHRILCTILYLAVLVLFTLTVLGYLPTKKLLYPLFGLPLVYHIFVEDTRLYFFAEPPVPVWDWMPELSVLCIMAALLSVSIAMKTEKI